MTGLTLGQAWVSLNYDLDENEQSCMWTNVDTATTNDYDPRMPALFLDRPIVVGPFQCNCHLLVCTETGEAACVDPGDDADQILGLIKKT
ncbi:MAG: hypothetical protein EOP09_11475, partial [Proteobacteria bacterium]